MKRKPIWKELNLPPPSKKVSTPATAADPVRQQAASETLRSNCVRTLLSALSASFSSGRRDGAHESAAKNPDGPDPGDAVEPSQLPDLAESIERELFLRHQSTTGQDYKAAARALVASLKRNDELRRRVVFGSLRPGDLASMGSRELATSEQQQEYARLEDLEARRVTLAGRGAAILSTTDYRCARCGGNTCDYLDSGRRDIGKCETWGSKDGQGASRLVTCLGCGFRWEVDDV